MEKTKLGISVGLMGALMFLICLAGGYVAAILVAGYILLREENRWLKETAIKAVAVLVGFGLLSALLGVIPGTFSFMQSVAELIDGYLDATVIYRFFNVLTTLLAVVRTVVFILLAWKALKQQNVSVPVVDSLLKKHTEE